MTLSRFVYRAAGTANDAKGIASGDLSGSQPERRTGCSVDLPAVLAAALVVTFKVDDELVNRDWLRLAGRMWRRDTSPYLRRGALSHDARDRRVDRYP